MRLDKFLKVSRLIKRRTVANEACDAGRVMVNDRPAKASVNVKEGDIIEIQFGTKSVKVQVENVQETVKKGSSRADVQISVKDSGIFSFPVSYILENEKHGVGAWKRSRRQWL